MSTPQVPTSVLTLARRQDRRDAFASRWSLPYAFHTALENQRPADSCYTEHLTMIGRGARLVFEDDAAPAFDGAQEELIRLLQDPPAAPLLILGGLHAGPSTPVDDEHVVPSRLNGSHCYLVLDPPRVMRHLLALRGHHEIDDALGRVPGVLMRRRALALQDRALGSDIRGAARDLTPVQKE